MREHRPGLKVRPWPNASVVLHDSGIPAPRTLKDHQAAVVLGNENVGTYESVPACVFPLILCLSREFLAWTIEAD